MFAPNSHENTKWHRKNILKTTLKPPENTLKFPENPGISILFPYALCGYALCTLPSFQVVGRFGGKNGAPQICRSNPSCSNSFHGDCKSLTRWEGASRGSKVSHRIGKTTDCQQWQHKEAGQRAIERKREIYICVYMYICIYKV